MPIVNPQTSVEEQLIRLFTGQPSPRARAASIMAVPGPAAVGLPAPTPIRYVPLGPRELPGGYFADVIRRVLGGAASNMPRQPGLGLVGGQVPSSGLVGASMESQPQLLTALDRLRAFTAPQQAPMAEAGTGLPSEQLINLMSILRQAIGLSSRQ